MKQQGIQSRITWNPQKATISLFSKNGKELGTIKVTDSTIKARRDDEIFNGDWQVFLRKIFGDEYMHFLGKKDVDNEFVPKLTSRDILDLVPFHCLYEFEERTALEKGTRRFKIKKDYDGPMEELVVGPLFQMGTVQFYGATEESFSSYMKRRFGIEYEEWCEQHACS